MRIRASNRNGRGPAAERGHSDAGWRRSCRPPREAIACRRGEQLHDRRVLDEGAFQDRTDRTLFGRERTVTAQVIDRGPWPRASHPLGAKSSARTTVCGSIGGLPREHTARAYLREPTTCVHFVSPGHWPELTREISLLAWAADRFPAATRSRHQPSPLPPPTECRSRLFGEVRWIGRPPIPPPPPSPLPGRLNGESVTAADRSAAAERIASFLRQLHILRPPLLLPPLPRRSRLSFRARTRVASPRRPSCGESTRDPAHLEPGDRLSWLALFGRYRDSADNFTFEPVELRADLGGDAHSWQRCGRRRNLLRRCEQGQSALDFHSRFLDFGLAFALAVARLFVIHVSTTCRRDAPATSPWRHWDHSRRTWSPAQSADRGRLASR